MQSRLSHQVLKEVSRSFYLSLRFLPRGFRAPTSVGYLLARASDTVADAGALELSERKRWLDGFGKRMRGEGELVTVDFEGLSRGEAVLMERLEECLASFDALPEEQRASVAKVVGIITEGQKWDLERFEGERIVSLESDEELRNYTYQVAGCVGEFWTEIGFGVDEDFASLEKSEMMSLGQAYGRSLQLINILRDVPEDLENGRCYLPGGYEVDLLLANREKWIAEARDGLKQADRYAEALAGKRMRFGTVLPAMIGRATLDLLEQASWDDWQRGVKVTRPEVKMMMVRAAKFALF